MKHNFSKTLITLLLLITINTLGQNPQGRGKGMNGKNMPAIGELSGQILDTITKEPIEYATIALYSARDNELAGGTITEKNGKFFMEKIKPGKYNLKISFLGYENKTIENVKLTPPDFKASIGKVYISSSMESLNEVVVDGSYSRVDYKIDKKIINVGKQITSISGTAVDVLENVPSVKVDIEGNVSLRGSTGFTVLIDGRPSVLDANDALQQIPASTIDNIEIITNPSAKFDPDGSAGIINIITKKNKLNGVSGIINANVGLNKKYGGDFLVNYKKRNLNFFVGADYNVRSYPGTQNEERTTRYNDTITRTLIDGDNTRERNMWGFRTGLDYSIGSSDIIGVGFRFGDRRMNRESDLAYDVLTTPGDLLDLYSINNLTERGGQFYDLTANYQHKFIKKGHELKADVSYAQREFDDNSISETKDENGNIVEGIKNMEFGPSSRIRGKVDYTLPFSETNKFEAGYQIRYSQSEDKTALEFLNTTSGEYEDQEEYQNKTNYTRNIHSIYSTYSGEMGNFGYQGGLRGEYTFRDISYDGGNYGIDRWDVFPTIHLSYNLPKDNQVMTSYTRRIDRPRGWYLEPFLTWEDPFNVRQGNPDLQPEYIDSYELSYLKKFDKKALFSLEGYYRMTHDKVERVKSVYSENVFLHTIQNVGNDFSLGVEFLFSITLFKWWEVDLMGDLYNYKMEGEYEGNDYSKSSTNYSSRFNNTFNIKKNTKIQLNSMYNGPSITAQGETKEFYMVNVAVRQDFFDRKFSAVLQARDIFATAKHEFISEGMDFYTHSEFRREAPMVTLSLSYKFNNYRANKKSRGGNDSSDMEEM